MDKSKEQQIRAIISDNASSLKCNLVKFNFVRDSNAGCIITGTRKDFDRFQKACIMQNIEVVAMACKETPEGKGEGMIYLYDCTAYY